MSVEKYTRGIPTYTDTEGNRVGMLCETKEKCITDDNGVSLESKLQQISDGTQQVGNAKTLDGHEAEYFATVEEIIKHSVPRYNGNTEDEINAIYNSLHNDAEDGGTRYEARVFHNVGHSVLGGGNWYVIGFRISANYGWQIAICYGAVKTTIFTRSINGSTWTGWGEVFTTAGGTINGNVMVSKNGAGLVSVEDTANGRQIGLLTSGGKCGLYDYTNSKWIVENTADGTNTFNGTASGNLPINNTTFPTVKNSQDVIMALESTSSTANKNSMLRFLRNGTIFGCLGFDGENNPVFMATNNTNKYSLLHTGNKPSGTYTGNGDATKRIIDIGSTIPRGIIVTSEKGMVIMTYFGAIYKERQGTTVSGLSWDECALLNNPTVQIQLVTTNQMLNAEGVAYTYYSL